MNVLVVTATRREAAALGEKLDALVAGTGPSAGAALVERLAAGRADLVLVAGFCGGLDPSLAAGSVILARQVSAPGLPIIEPDHLFVSDVKAKLHALQFPFVFSRLLTLGAPAATKDEKRDLWNEHGAGGVDMETYPLASAAAAAGVPWLAVRVVIDHASVPLPRSLSGWDGEGSERQLMAKAALRPLEWPAYARLAWAMPKAQRALRRATTAVAAAARQANVRETLPMVEVAQR